MALKDFLDLVDPKLADIYNHVAADPAKARKPFIRAIDRTIKQYEEGKQPRGEGKWWSANNQVVMFTPNVDGRAIDFGKGNPMPVPAERFLGGLRDLRAVVESGGLDDKLAGDGTEPKTETKTKRTRAPHTPERIAKTAATRAANKAAKEAAAKLK